MKVAFIGLGRMGRGMAHRILGGGHDLVVHDVVRTAGYGGIVAIVFAESGLAVGLALPGDSLLFTAGFLASRHVLSIGWLVPLATFDSAAAGLGPVAARLRILILGQETAEVAGRVSLLQGLGYPLP